MVKQPTGAKSRSGNLSLLTFDSIITNFDLWPRTCNAYMTFSPCSLLSLSSWELCYWQKLPTSSRHPKCHHQPCRTCSQSPYHDHCSWAEPGNVCLHRSPYCSGLQRDVSFKWTPGKRLLQHEWAQKSQKTAIKSANLPTEYRFRVLAPGKDMEELFSLSEA